MNTPKSVCYNGAQIIAWVAALKDEPKVFATGSLFLLREMYLQGIPAANFRLCVALTVAEGTFPRWRGLPQFKSENHWQTRHPQPPT